MTRERFRNTSEEEYSCNISDIGEGKSIVSNTEKREYGFTHTDRRFGLREYQAPEVSTLGHSWMSDMYSFGQLGVDIIRFGSQYLSDPDTGKLRVPVKLLQILDTCLAQNHEERYEADLAVAMLEEITYDLTPDDEIAFVEEENLSEQFPHRQLSSWDSLTT